MIPKILDNAGLEHVYDAIAAAIDATPESRRVVMLAKLSLTLANLAGDPAKVTDAVAAAMRDL